jgi:hypothetical protein
VVDGYVGLGVPIGTDAFIQHCVKDKCQAIMEDVDKLDNIQDGFIHYQLIRFCQATRLQYVNGQITLANQNVLQQHVDHHIASALLKKGTQDVYKTWNQQDRAWVHMRLHESHDEGGFGVTNVITRHAASYDQRQVCCLPWHLCPPCSTDLAAGQRSPGSSHMGRPPSPPAHACARDLLQHYDSTDQPASAPQAPPSAGGSAAVHADANPQPQPAGSQDNGNGKLVLPQLNRLHEAFKRSGVSTPACSSSQDQPTRRRPIPSQRRLTQQLTKDWTQMK